MSEGAFLFAVCGEREHLDRAARAAALLRRWTRRRVVILTDPARNAGPVAHDDLLPMSTPPRLSHGQAAIFLKSSAANALPAGGPHVYLDSDVFAVSSDVEKIFGQFRAPVTFASDLPTPRSNLRTFSSHAVACACGEERERLERHFARLDSLTAFHRAHRELAALDDERLYASARFVGARRQGKWWQGEASGESEDRSIAFRQRFEAGVPVEIVYCFSGSPWTLEKTANGSVFRDAAEQSLRFVSDPDLAGGGYWEDERGDSLRRAPLPSGEERWWFRAGEARYRWQVDSGRDAGGFWSDARGGELGACDHLAEQLERRFGVAIADRAFVPWNGGVFLFDAGSRAFLEDWRSRCLALFEEPGFLSRDQGALVATVWARGLESHSRLPSVFNRIVDRRSPAAARLRLAELRAAGDVLLHLIGGGADDLSWPLGRDLAPLLSEARPRSG